MRVFLLNNALKREKRLPQPTLYDRLSATRPLSDAWVDMAPSILITTPILLPVVTKFGVDPVHFGMIMLMNRDRFVPSAGRRDAVRRLRRRARAHGGRHTADLAVLRRHVPRADGGHLHPGDLALAAVRPLSLSDGALSFGRPNIEKLTVSVI